MPHDLVDAMVGMRETEALELAQKMLDFIFSVRSAFLKATLLKVAKCLVFSDSANSFSSSKRRSFIFW